MYIIIVGAGEVGSYLARILVEEQHDVAIIERNEQLARTMEASLDALVVPGNGVSLETLKRAGIKKADLVLAVTHVDEVNLIACMTASKFGNAPRTVARVREAQYLSGEGALSARELGLSMLIGPGLGTVGEACNFSHIPDPGLYLLSFGMLLGRLEIYTVLVLFTVHFWRRG